LEIKSPVLSTQLNQIASIDTATKLREIEISGLQLKAIQQDVFANVGIHTLPQCTISLKVQHQSFMFFNIKALDKIKMYHIQIEHWCEKFAERIS
jgi:hypothetical protein